MNKQVGLFSLPNLHTPHWEITFYHSLGPDVVYSVYDVLQNSEAVLEDVVIGEGFLKFTFAESDPTTIKIVVIG